ncbi:MAG: UDP-2,3-diacylglucosamine diphosphatase [Ignavibacteriales bacterium]|nr:UDP-2,3-diacylglucosamine diphosphatase [Ignavibacteriales bacterium]
MENYLTSFFVSDLHFGLLDSKNEKLREESFVEFLKFCNGRIDKLFILGDLFDYWFEYKRVIQKGYFRTFTAINELVKNKIEVHYFIGNHDFMHRDFFEKEIGTILYEDAAQFEIDGKKFFLGHGDGLVENDLGYNILKKILRNKSIQKLYSLLHPDFGIWLASSSSRKSRDYTTEKSYGQKDGLYEAAKKKIDQGYDYVLFGHTHIRKVEDYKNGKYINLGTWLNQPCYGKFENGNFEIIDWNNK